MKKYLAIVFVVLSYINILFAQHETIDLDGKWDFKIDRNDVGIPERWFAEKLDDKVILPGSMTTNLKGDNVTSETKWTGNFWNRFWYTDSAYAEYRKPSNVKITSWLQPVKHYVGAAWYQKEITIPENWKNKCIDLVLERCHWETQVWIDDSYAGMQNSLAASHIYDLAQLLLPGKHTITIRIDNRVKDIDPGLDAHSISDNTQTNWNGIIGEIKLIAKPLVNLFDIKVFPDIEGKKISVKITTQNNLNEEVDCELRICAEPVSNFKQNDLKTITHKIVVAKGVEEKIINYEMGSTPFLWDEFHPNLYALKVGLITQDGIDARNIQFGMRKLEAKGTQIFVNGRPTFLRGTLECAIFPMTGFPSTDVNEWKRIYNIIKEHGLNHMRFHSWCPPEAAFTAADQEGIYLYVECCAWAAVGDGKPIDKFVYDESERIVNAYGNHPSFCFMSYGNEPGGENLEKYLYDFVDHWKKKDSRRLYTTASGWPSIEINDFHISGTPRIQGWQEELNSIINAQPPSTEFNWTDRLTELSSKPVISHEIGQWCVYPNFEEMKKYTGILKPKNFEIFQETLKRNGLENYSEKFLSASGKLQALCYKADIEAALRTPGFAGFELLDLHDFPGQGTALVGVLDPFWDEKGYIKPEEYKKFCNSTVPLMKMKKLVFSSSEMFEAEALAAHYGEKVIENVIPEWNIKDQNGKTLFGGKLSIADLEIDLNLLGKISVPLESIQKASQLDVTLSIGEFSNSWNIWVYPDSNGAIPNEEEIKIVQSLDGAAIEFLNKGGKVLLTPAKGTILSEKGGDVAIGFSSIFWNTAWTNKQKPHTLGILCDPAHEAFNSFPTEYFSNYQWWDAITNSSAIRMKYFPDEIEPIVRVIDDWYSNQSLALIFEAKAGKGKIIVCGIDLLTNLENRIEARQLLYSLKKYMLGKSFDPKVVVDSADIISLIKK
ncbi:MAG: sugar-binding domain-containing protein [Bacteroidota bacterium]